MSVVQCLGKSLMSDDREGTDDQGNTGNGSSGDANAKIDGFPTGRISL